MIRKLFLDSDGDADINKVAGFIVFLSYTILIVLGILLSLK